MQYRQPRVLVTKEFSQALKNYSMQKHLLAAKIGLTPAFFSYMVNRMQLIPPGDERIKKIAKAIKFDGQCFEELPEDQPQVITA